MTTSSSPLSALKKQSDEIAKIMKKGVRGEVPTFPAYKDPVKVGVVMDDKVITIEISRQVVLDTTELALSEMILREMQGKRPDSVAPGTPG